ncbi:MAG: hypothetical protein IT317_05770 [Anaerolineales bacterium]|nr:hypothetical protein [Anaerolineales bacterium]
MPPRLKTSTGVEALQRVEGRAQVALALDLVARDKDPRAVRAALEVLQAHPTPDARPVLQARFEQLAADGVRRDAGTYLRAAIVRALRPMAGPEDLPVLERAVTTYEWLPPRSEEASLLRSAGLVVLNDVDGGPAGFHAVRLLADEWTARLSGEPALTAVGVLASLGRFDPLYYYALHQGQPQSEVLSDCLRRLTVLPEALARELAERHGATRDEVVLVGLLDLLLEHPGAPFAPDWVRGWMAATELLAVYHYLVTKLAATPDALWRAVLLDQAAHERRPRQLALLEEALALARPAPETQAGLAAVRRRRNTTTGDDEADDA